RLRGAVVPLLAEVTPPAGRTLALEVFQVTDQYTAAPVVAGSFPFAYVLHFDLAHAGRKAQWTFALEGGWLVGRYDRVAGAPVEASVVAETGVRILAGRADELLWTAVERRDSSRVKERVPDGTHRATRLMIGTYRQKGL